MPTVIPNYLELTTTDLGQARAFYEAALGLRFTPYGTEYAAAEGGPTEVGLRRAPTAAPPLPVFEADDLEAVLAALQVAGGVLVRDIYPYPGGRRFEALDPDGNRIAVYQRS